MRTGNLRPVEPALILLSGLPGAGKTTFAHALAQVLDFEHVESDAIRRSMAAQPTYSGPESAAVFARAEALAAAALAAGRHALVDATNLTPKDRKRFIKLADRAAGALIAIRVTAPDAVIRERLASPRAGYSQADVGVYEMMRGRPRLFSTPVVVVDTRFDLAPSVELVRQLVAEQGA